MNYKIYMRGGEEAAKVIKALQIESLAADHNIPDYGSDENKVYGIPRYYSGEKLYISWSSIHSNLFKNADYIEVTPAQFYKTISGREWVSEVFPKLQKEKIYCFGSEFLKEVLTKLVNAKICEYPVQYLNKAKDPDTVWGYRRSHNMGAEIGYSSDKEWFSNADYKLVTPEEFYKIWSGKDWDCKESVKPEKKYIGFIGSTDVNISLLPGNIKNPDNIFGVLSNAVYYIKDNVLYMVKKHEEEELLEKIDVLDWIGFLAVITASPQELDSISKRIKAFSPARLSTSQPSKLETESSDCSKLILLKKQTLKIVL